MKQITTEKTLLTEYSETLRDLFKDINKYKIYSGEEQIELAREAKKGNLQARNKLINSNLRFVITCAKKYINQGVSLLDLIQAGFEGLCQSVDKFDPDKGYKFLSFAVWYIRREILKEIYNTSRTIRYPITYISKITKVKKVYNDFLVNNNREPTDEELINLSNLTEKQYNSVILDKSYCQSIDTPINDDENSTLENFLTSEEKFSDVFTQETVSKCLKVLNPREYKVISEYYGLDGQDEKSIKEIAKEMGLGDERIRQLRKNGVKKLNKRCGKILKTLL